MNINIKLNIVDRFYYINVFLFFNKFHLLDINIIILLKKYNNITSTIDISIITYYIVIFHI